MVNHTSANTPQIKISQHNIVGRIALSNPAKHNALPQRLWEELPELITRLIDQGARVIILEGEGKSFCAGADISEFDVVRKNAETAQIYETANADAFSAVREAKVPVIAKIKGYCLGGGFGLAAACDIRIAETNAQFGVPAAKLGLAYPVKAMADIVHAVGAQNAKRLLFTAERFSAVKMKEFGFLAEVVSEQELEANVVAMAKNIAELAPLTHQATKAAIDAALGGNAEIAAKLGSETFTSTDYTEGRAAFSEKRLPEFKGS